MTNVATFCAWDGARIGDRIDGAGRGVPAQADRSAVAAAPSAICNESSWVAGTVELSGPNLVYRVGKLLPAVSVALRLSSSRRPADEARPRPSSRRRRWR